MLVFETMSWPLAWPLARCDVPSFEASMSYTCKKNLGVFRFLSFFVTL